MLPTWLCPAPPSHAAAARHIALSSRSAKDAAVAAVTGIQARPGRCMDAVRTALRGAGETGLTLRELMAAIRYPGTEMGACLAKLQAKGSVTSCGKRQGRRYFWREH